MDLANAQPDDFDRFEWKWGNAMASYWRGGLDDFNETRQKVQSIWNGNDPNYAYNAINAGLGLYEDHPEYRGTSRHLLRVNWENGYLWVSPRDLNEWVWLSLLQYSKKLGICANKPGGCPAPYFIKKKPKQKFCSDVCALPAQREFKRNWFREHGAEWRRKRAKTLARTRGKATKRTRRR
jgi:hypothetical protein